MERNPYQGSESWHLARRGMITSSRMHTIVHGGPRSWLTLTKKLRAEMASDVPLEPDLEHVPSIAWGRRHEPVAIANAELMLDTEFELVGFQRHRKLDYLGCSSDALAFFREANVEVKCPMNIDEHRRVYQTRRIPDKHIAQVQCQMAVWEVPKTLFVSYHPDMPHWKLQTVIVEVPIDPIYQRLMLAKCAEFMAAFNGQRLAHAPAMGKLPQLF